MIKKFGTWLTLLVVTVIGVIVGWNWHAFQPHPQALEANYQQELSQGEMPPAWSDTPVIAPSVNVNALINNLKAIDYRRYTEEDRSRARQYITDMLTRAGWKPQTQNFDGGINIYAEHPGTDPQAGAILLAAHYDTVESSPGIDDNATGVATVLEAARLLGDRATPRKLILAFFDLEERGLLGSSAFVNQLPIQSIQGAIVLEMIGFACHTEGCQHYPSLLPFTPPTTEGNFLAIVGDQGHLPLINTFQKSQKTASPQVLTLPVPLLGPFTPDLLRSDHAPFWQKGIGAVMVTDTANFRNPNYHQPSDTLATIDPAFFAGSAQHVIDAVTSLISTRGSLATPPSVPQNDQLRPAPSTAL
jgi:hypothetical protein